MMPNHSFTSRRKFLGGLGVLSAGVFLAPALRLFSGSPAENTLREEWDLFCSRHGGVSVSNSDLLSAIPAIEACSGHKHIMGEVIAFAGSEVMAVPTWIYWAGREAPSDMFVSFFEWNGVPRPIITLNRFQLTGLNLLHAVGDQPSSGILQELTELGSPHAGKRFFIKADWRNNRIVLSSTDAHNPIRFQKTHHTFNT